MVGLTDSEDWRQLQHALMHFGFVDDMWLCRGAVRCALLGELRDWDDFDVITEVSEYELHSEIIRSDIKFSRTIHGGYSFRLPSTRKVDIWSLTSTLGRSFDSLPAALRAFEFNVDAIAVSVNSSEIVDPLEVRTEIVSRKIRFQGDPAPQTSYVAWKAAYLVLRHSLTPDDSVGQLWQVAPVTDGIPEKAIHALQDELRLLGIHDCSDHARSTAKKYLGFGRYVNELINSRERHPERNV